MTCFLIVWAILLAVTIVWALLFALAATVQDRMSAKFPRLRDIAALLLITGLFARLAVAPIVGCFT